MLYATWFALAVAFATSSVLSNQLAKRYGRDEVFYGFAGLFLGPLALLLVLTPLPSGNNRRSWVANKQIRFVKGSACPECRRQVGVRATMCPYCRTELEPAWWDNASVSITHS